jgi:hypothetical protein
MVNRLFGICVILIWVSSMAGLLVRDVWPAWTAREPPPTPSGELIDRIGEKHQYGIFRSSGARIGTSWTTLEARTDPSRENGGHDSAFIRSSTYFPSIFALQFPIWVDLNIDLLADGTLDNFKFDIEGPPIRVHAEGEAYGSKLACTFQVGLVRRSFSLEASSSRLIGERFQMFSCLPELRVGQAWRMQVIDPLPAITSGQLEPRAILVRVTGRETIDTAHGPVEAFVVQTEGARAWIDPAGLVIEQQVDVPLLGRVTIRREDFDELRRERALDAVDKTQEASQ